MYDKPGCYGNAITYSNKSPACAKCDESQSCALAALQRIEELRAMVSVDSVLKMSHSASQKAQKRLPDSTERIVATMNSRQQKAVGILMTLESPTPGVLVQTLMQKLKWQKDEAVQTAKETVGVLLTNNLASVEGGRILLRY
jgi:hypothetical protein